MIPPTKIQCSMVAVPLALGIGNSVTFGLCRSAIPASFCSGRHVGLVHSISSSRTYERIAQQEGAD